MRFALALLLLLLSPLSPPRGERVRVRGAIPWAWERRENLTFLADGHPVAWYAGILTLTRDAVKIEPRRNPLLLPKNAHRIAVIRIETDHPRLDAAQHRATLGAIARLFRNAEELQLDFDATTSERAFYRALLFDVRKTIDAPLTITALASWCMDDRWMGDLPIDDAVPMLFRMGSESHAIRARLARGEDFREPRCRASVGVSIDEPIDFSHGAPRGRRVWVFNPNRWTEDAWKSAKPFESR